MQRASATSFTKLKNGIQDFIKTPPFQRHVIQVSSHSSQQLYRHKIASFKSHLDRFVEEKFVNY